MTAFLATYRPICATAHGRRAVERFAIPPFVDASCRREPDFESPLPSITALCRGRKFAPRLHEGDRVIYLTRKGRYGDVSENHWRLVAVLEAVERFESHHAAAAWYRSKGFEIPRNCMVEGNRALELGSTGGPRPLTRFGDPKTQSDRVIRRWDHGYRQRAADCGVFLATRAVYLELRDPPMLTEDDLHLFGGGMPGTQNPPRIEDGVVESLLRLALGRRGDRAA